MAMQEIITLKTTQFKECIEITEQVRAIVRNSGIETGLCHVMTLHATAGIIVNENADPNIGVDLITALDKNIPDHDGWLHDRVDNNAQAHIKASILGPSETLPIQNGDLLLGTWQGIMLVELDGPRSQRKIVVSLIPTALSSSLEL
jgi:secondary thiamine-phosphate synthase enzyme